MEWEQSNPVFPVADVAAAMDWYGRMFGFEPRVVHPPDETPVCAVVCRDGLSIHLLQGDEAPHGLAAPVQAQFRIDDELFESVKGMGAEVIQEPGERPWGTVTSWWPIPTATSSG